ncbi:glycosyl hydrolase family 18 protein [Catenovulum sediminis]|uniref:Glycosyl hydrolase family 18 protein n=1 Tax=Catenovulum sediminis TaxID=1740262 RepID=A0ABV1RN08_9ALTE
MKSTKLLRHTSIASALFGILAAPAANALDCSGIEAWQQGQAYSGGSKVQAQGSAYSANWWTQTDPVENSGEWQDWSFIAVCDSAVSNEAPVVFNLSPQSGFSMPSGDSVVISVDASDDKTVSQVEFSVDSVVIGVDLQAPYEMQWTAEKGEYSISVIAKDDEGLVSEPVSVSILVTEQAGPINEAPVANIQLTSTNQITVGESADFILSATDADGSIERLSFSLAGQNLATVQATQAEYQWTANAAGDYEFTLVATDNEGDIDTKSVTISVRESADNKNADDCRPAGLYQTPGVNTPYCTVYDVNGREMMGADHPRRIIGYFTSWRNGANDQPSYLVNDIPWDKITHINYAFAHVDANNRVSIGDPNAPGNPATNMEWPSEQGAEMDPSLPYKGHFNLLNKYKKQYPDVKTLISVGGWAETGGYFASEGRVASGGFYTMTTNADGSTNYAGIQAFCQSVVEFIEKYGFDGVDIDYEYPSSMNDSGHPDDFEISNARRAGLNASYRVLMKSLRETLDEAGEAAGKHYMLTIASPSSGYLLRGMETFQAAQYLDYVNIMSYDLHGAWNAHVGHNASLFDTGKDSELAAWNVYGTKEFEGIGYLNTDWAVRYFRGALSAGRINIGIPYYTRGFRDVSGSENGLWGQAPLPNQSECPKGTGSGEKNKCGNGAIGIDNLWHDKENDREVPAGSNPLWHAKNLQSGVVPSYLSVYGLDPVSDPDDRLVGTYQRFYDEVAVAPWLWNDEKKVFISIEDEESMATKVDYVIDNGLGGIMFWELAGDFAYDQAKDEYFMGSTLTSLAYDKFNQSGVAYDVHMGSADFEIPAEAVDIEFVVKDFPIGDDNYPISPTFSFTNNSELDLSGAKVSFDVPVATSAIFKSNWNAQEKLGMAVEVNRSNAAGNNIGGFENEFHRFSISFVNEWGGEAKAFAPGDTIDAQVMYYMPITGPVNFTIEKDGKVYAFKAEYPNLSNAQPTEPTDPNDPTEPTEPTDSCEGKPVSEIPVYPNWPQTDWQGNPSHAAGGDLMTHNNAVFKAKWWTQSEPGTTADWEQVCRL